MDRTERRMFCLEMINETNMETQVEFAILGKGKRTYTGGQRDFVLSLIDQYGVRATSRILQIPRRTIQRWCRKRGKFVSRCPYWVYRWAEARRKRREFWRRRGYY